MNAVPLTLKVLGALAAILAANTLAGNLIVSLIIGVLVLGVWCGHGLPDLVMIIWRRALTLDNVLLLVAVYQVISLSLLMKAAGLLDALVKYVRRRISRRLSLAALPAIIGLLPMPGGALFSAPLVESCDRGGTVQPIDKITINYWFRHVWEFWWPLYPGVILAIDLSGLEVWQFMLVQVPFSLVALLAGYVVFLRKIEVGNAESPDLREPNAAAGGGALAILSPIVITMVIYALVMIGWSCARRASPSLPVLQRYVPMIIGLTAGMLLIQLRHGLSRRSWKQTLLSSRTVSILVLVVIIRIFGVLVEARLPGGAPMVEAMQQELFSWNVPLVPVMIIIPFLAGLSTGLSVGFVGASFPIVMNLLGPDPALLTLLATASLTYCAGYAGMMLSPVHVCLIATNQHFRTELTHSLGRILPLSLLVLAVSSGYYYLLLTGTVNW